MRTLVAFAVVLLVTSTALALGGVAALSASDGGGMNGSRLVAESGAAVSRAPVAPAADGLSNGAAR